ncbi:endonuclease/exonuclease/phosphatase family protein [Maribacter sp. X9]|uniref:endonuclease/exonuclease/phosphatase family protein n=1 Tax=Maribacter sp. X9 TaxID=3402159 RepID=UPI003AF3FD5E
MKIAAFNVENLFDRAKAFNEKATISNPIITGVSELNNIFEKSNYSDIDKENIVQLFKLLGFEKSDIGKYACIRKIRGKLAKRPKDKPIEIIANGREDWIGWVELKTEPVNEIAILNTGRVIRDVNADILAVVEAENRILLDMFSHITIKTVNGSPYSEVMLIDGNDQRGIDVGVMCKNGYKIHSVKSHIYDLDDTGKTIFSRDCPEYEIFTPNGEKVIVLPNHFKSKYGFNQNASDAKRKTQAARTAEIYNGLLSDGEKNIIILGDLNDTPDSEPLIPLLENTNLKDVSEHPSFDPGEYKGKGTYGLGGDKYKIDYMLVSPILFEKIKSSGLFRKGAWPGKRKPKWEVYESIEKEIHVASDHHVIWADFNI